MDPQENSINRPEFKSRKGINWGTLSLCLFVAIILWLFVSLSKVYQVNLTMPVRFTDAPPEISLVIKKSESVSLQVKANGFNLMMHYLLKPIDTLELSLSENRDKPFYLTNRNLKNISQSLPYTLEAVDAKPDTLFFLFDSKGKKRVPVQSQVKINWEGSWLPTSTMEMIPDSVTLYGSEADLKKVKRWKTQSLQFDNIQGTFDTWVALDTVRNIIPQPQKIRLIQKSSEFTQARKTVKVQVQNLPGKKKIRLMPDTVQIAYLVPMHQFEEAEEATFTVDVDFSRLRQDQEFVIPRIRQKPEFVKNVTISPERIRFVITNLKK
jgi:hypothetical protein